MSAEQPSVSVLVTLEREREHAPASIQSWGPGQTYDGAIEVVALSDADGAAPQPAGLPGVRVVNRPGATRTELFDAAARATDADVLVFTEAHCLAAPDCLEELIALIARGEFVGACATTVGVAENAFARLDQRLFDEGFAVVSRPEDWRKVWPHGFAIRRDAYLRAGGFEHRFGFFGEQLLAARLHRQGSRLGYAERAVVEHHFGTELREVLDHVESATRGRELWEAHATSDDGLESQLWPPPGGRGSIGRRQALLLAIALARGARSGGMAPGARAGAGIARRHLRSLLPPAVLGRHGELAIARARTAAAVARCHAWRRDEERLEHAYRDLWLRVVEETRVRCRQPAPTAGRIAEPGRHPIGSIPNRLLAGFHEPFVDAGEVVRWSGPALGFDTALSPGSYEIRLETSELRPAGGVSGVAAYLGMRRLPAAQVRTEAGAIALRPDPAWLGQEQHWVVACAPAAVPQERTGYLLELGLPVRAIVVEASSR